MRWRGRRQSSNVEDRRGSSGGGFRLPGGLGRRSGGRSGGRINLPLGRRGGGLSLGALALIVVASWAFGIDPALLLGGGPGPGSGSAPQSIPAKPRSADEERLSQFVRVNLADTEDTWDAILSGEGTAYRDPVLVLFSGSVRSACGHASAASGPFYCPGDSKVYIDLDFYSELEKRLNSPGDFAQAYVLAHEVGHHVQNLLGILPEYERVRRTLGKADANALSVRVELQADCFAGLWANHAARRRGFLEQGDIEEGLNAASQIGDDTLQRRSQGYAVPESFNHGTSDQRVNWFSRGFKEGRIKACDTFSDNRI